MDCSSTWRPSAEDLTSRSSSEPRVVDILFLDLDGTVLNSYAALGAIEAWAKAVSRSLGKKDHQEAFDAILTYFKKNIQKDPLFFQQILHETTKTLAKAERRLAHQLNLPHRFHYNGEEVQAYIRKSYEPLPGAKKLLELAEQSETAVVLLTNSGPSHTISRLVKAGIPPQHLRAIYTRDSKGNWQDNGKHPFKGKIRTYATPKPHPGPMKEIAEKVSSEGVLFIGEGVTDFGCVENFNKTSESPAIFAFHRQGAAAVDPYVGINDCLRKHRLGLSHIQKSHPRIETHQDVLVLHKGFVTLNDLIEKKKVVLSPTLYPPVFGQRSLEATHRNHCQT